MHDLDEMTANDLYNLFVNVMDLQFINVNPLDARGLHELFVTGLKRLSANVHPRDVRESMDVMQ